MCGQSNTTTQVQTTKPVELAPGVVAANMNGKDVYFKLEFDGYDLDLIAVQPDGDFISRVVGIENGGRLVRYSGVSEELGLDLGSVSGQIVG